jgi:glycosyltransferase involved in cell wall biosynthesis
MPEPFFSVLITAYNRAGQIERCVGSCTAQTFPDFEIVVADDASTDATVAVLEAIGEPRLRIVQHEQNRGISPARRTTVEHARGRWLVVLDSDWELVPHSLARLRELIDTLPPGVRIIRSRLGWDDGSVSPAIIPEGVTDYQGRLEWLEALAVSGSGSDAGHCMHRDVFSTGNHFHDGRGLFESFWETNLARTQPSLWVPDVLGLEHTDAANSSTREADPKRLIPRMLAEAHDFRWQVEAMLSEHGSELARYAPHYRQELLERAALETFMAGDRRAGIRHSREALKAGATGVQPWATLTLGVLGARPLARAKLAGRQFRARRNSEA